MQTGVFGLGWSELLIIVLVVALLILPLVIAGVVLFAMLRAKSQTGSGPWTPNEPLGPSTRVRLLGPTDKPIAESASWDSGELLVKSDQWSSTSLFDVPLNRIEQCMLTYRFRIKTDNLQRAVYPELWCRIPERGQFFSRGLNCKVRGTNAWKVVEIPFFLQGGQRADLLHLNLVFEGPGTVRLKDIEVLATPTKPSG